MPNMAVTGEGGWKRSPQAEKLVKHCRFLPQGNRIYKQSQAQPGSAIFLMTCHHFTWMQLKIDLSGGWWLYIVLCTRSGTSSY